MSALELSDPGRTWGAVAPVRPPAHRSFQLPAGREATRPPEHRGLMRDQVAMMVARPDGITHGRFDHLGVHLRPGDLLVVNTSATMPAALDGSWRGGPLVVHLATRRDDDTWVVELRRSDGSGPHLDAEVGERAALAEGATVTLLGPAGPRPTPPGGTRLWHAELAVPTPRRIDWLHRNGRPITYGYVRERFPLEAYQTVFARVPGSAEMASAARPFTAGLVTDLVSRGIGLAPVTLHAGVSSPEAAEGPWPERFEVPAATADRIEHTRQAGGRVVAVGTTVTRAIESAIDRRGRVQPSRGWTDLVLGPQRPAVAVGGLVTGWHEPGTSHLQLLEAVAGPELVAETYAAALAGDYLWHEFGDSCLLLP